MLACVFGDIRPRYSALITRPDTCFDYLCEPSQCGAFLVALHMHQKIFFFSTTTSLTGENPVPLWAPSQNGWLADFPQEHQK